MKASDLYLLAIIADNEPAAYADISLQSKSPDYFLEPKLHDLVTRGFIKIKDSHYELAAGVDRLLIDC